MPINNFLGSSQDIAQVTTFSITADDATTTYIVTCNNKTVSVLGTGTGATNTAAALVTALSSSSAPPEFLEISWSSNVAVITATGAPSANPGIPFTISTSVSGGSGTISAASTTANPSGHLWWADANNWSQTWIPQGACSPPVQSNAVASSGGSLSNGTTYYWVVTAINNNGETTVSNEKSLAISTPNLQATISWAQVNGATGYKIYRSTTSGTYGATSLVTTIALGSTLSFLDTGAALTTGTPPGVNGAVGDDVWITVPIDIRYGINQSAITLNSLNIPELYTADIGNPAYNPSGYTEYRATYLSISATTVNIGQGNSSGNQSGSTGSGQIKLNLGTVQTSVNCDGTGSTANTGYPSLMIQGSNASNVLNATQGSIGLAFEDGTTAQFPTINIGSQTSTSTDVNLTLGAGCTTPTTITQNGGIITNYVGATTWNKESGTSYQLGTSAITALNQFGACTHYWQSSGTIGTGLFQGKNCVLDGSRDLRAKALTNSTFYGGAYPNDPAKKITFTNPAQFDAVSAAACFSNNGFGTGTFNLQRS